MVLLLLALLSGVLPPPAAPPPDAPSAPDTICIPFIGCINL
ncbi:hypothetical protein RQM47_16110 [Rubrivirga sp. S365]|nr:hypothetical protein [Rubrivirga sp. S365]MDT7858173.1 hypothetical protein [Rubrivirga sp. S365]